MKTIAGLSLLLLMLTVYGCFSRKEVPKNQLHITSLAPESGRPIQAVFYLSPDGNDSNPGSMEKPFRTLERAKDEIRKINKNMTGDIIVCFASGDYLIKKTILFNKEDSGNNGFRIIYKGIHEPGSARLIGASPAVSWEIQEGKIFRTKIVTDRFINFIYEEGLMAEPARFPNSESGMHTYLRVAEEDTAIMTDHLIFKEGQIPAFQGHSSLLLYSFPGALDWNQSIDSIKKIDFSRNTIQIKNGKQIRYSFKKGTRYFIFGHAIELLDAPGELYHDRKAGYLYYYPFNPDNIAGEKIFIPHVDEIFKLSGDSISATEEGFVQNISFVNLTLGMVNYNLTESSDSDAAKTATISLNNVKHIEIKDCRIISCPGNAISFSGYASDNTVSGCFINEAGSSGIYINAGLTPTIKTISGNNKIQNNFITKIGYLSGGAGIMIGGSSNNIIENNTVCDCLRWGIALIGPGLSITIMKNDEIDGVKVNKEKPEENIKFNPTRNNIIRRNETFNCNTDSQDSGPIVTWGAIHTTVDNNLVYGTRGFGNQEGVYMDGGSHFSKVINNIVYDISSSKNGQWQARGSTFHIKGIKSEASNNIFDFTSQPGIQGIGFQSITGNFEISENIVFRKNILVSFSSDAGPIIRIHDGEGRPLENRLSVVDSNLYYTANGKYEVIAFRKGLAGINKFDKDSWLNVLDKKYDQHSIFNKDPLFIDPQNRNYSLRPESPAFSIGFVQPETSKIGLTNEFKYQMEIREFIERSRNAGPYIIREK